MCAGRLGRLLRGAQRTLDPDRQRRGCRARRDLPGLLCQPVPTGWRHLSLRAVRGRVAVPISIDTSKAAVAEAALAAGADLVNDVRGLVRDPDLAAVVARAGVPAVVMHDDPPDGRGDLVTGVLRELSRRLDRALAAGIAWELLLVDPGFGFGKDWRENLDLLRRLGGRVPRPGG